MIDLRKRNQLITAIATLFIIQTHRDSYHDAIHLLLTQHKDEPDYLKVSTQSCNLRHTMYCSFSTVMKRDLDYGNADDMNLAYSAYREAKTRGFIPERVVTRIFQYGNQEESIRWDVLNDAAKVITSFKEEPTQEQIDEQLKLDNWEHVQAIGKGEVREVSERIYDHFLNCMPPRNWVGSYFEMGEAQDYDVNTGKTIYMAFWKKEGKHFGALSNHPETPMNKRHRYAKA